LGALFCASFLALWISLSSATQAHWIATTAALGMLIAGLYRHGFDAGHKRGYRDGRDDGDADGYNRGWWSGYGSSVCRRGICIAGKRL
jgi:high-affinity Fe2+/Pb2+ permease